VVAASPLVRARETAAIAVETIAPGVSIHTWEELESGADCAATCRRFEGLNADDETILVVTHQPFAGRFVAYLTGEDTPMKTAMVACVEGDLISNGCCELRWTRKG
jgi:phosphohistidine phosphatase